MARGWWRRRGRESRLRTYPDISAITEAFITNVHQRAAKWSTVTDAGDRSDLPDDAASGPTSAPTPELSGPLDTSGVGCLPGLGGPRDVVVPPGTPHDVATAVRTALAYVGVTSGWHLLCDRLACRAYGYAGSGYPTATDHWQQMRQGSVGRMGDLGSPICAAHLVHRVADMVRFGRRG